MTAIAIQHREQILQRIADGQRVSILAKELGVSHQAISKALRNDTEYREALEAGLEAKLDASEIAIENSADVRQVARARALWQSATWRCEREVSGRWGAKQEVTHRHPDGPAIQVVIVAAPELARVVGESSAVSSAPQIPE